MPSYCRDRRKYRGKNYEEILLFLRHEERRKKQLETKFYKIINAIFPSKPPAVTSGYSETTMTITASRKQKLRFHQLLYTLQRDGLIKSEQSEGRGNETLYAITAAGLRWLENFKRKNHSEVPVYSGKASPHSAVTIISYDIPERSKYLRNWLRDALKNFGFKQMQRSVFIGKVKLPEQFIRDLVMLNLEPCVEIFEMTKTGTLSHRI